MQVVISVLCSVLCYEYTQGKARLRVAMASSNFRIWDGTEWENHIQLLLKCHYGPGNYQEVPARHRGDFGIEGYSMCGYAYQCYANQEPCTTEKRYELQRSKITTDLNKFIDNRVELEKLFGSIKIRRWILMSPVSESSRLVQHASKKGKDVLAAHLPYVAEDFQVIIDTDSCFAKEKGELCSVGKINIETPDISVEEIERTQWVKENTGLSGVLTSKIKKLPKPDSEEKVDELKTEMIENYIRGQNMIEVFEKTYPDVYVNFNAFKRSFEKQLKLESLINTAPAEQRFSAALQGYSEGLRRTFPNLPDSTVLMLSLEGMSDWLMRCPLDF